MRIQWAMRDSISEISTARCVWLVQSTVRGATLERLETACRENGNPLHRIDVIPFSESMPSSMPAVHGPFIFYGYTTLMLNAFRNPQRKAGVFFDPDVFRPSVYREKWGYDRMLNADANILTMDQFAAAVEQSPSKAWFIKPNDDLKRFTGGVMSGQQFLDWYVGIVRLNGEGDIGPATGIFVCQPKEMGHEWRIFIVDGLAVTRSCYTYDCGDLPIPPELERFALEAAREWSPAAAFALDVTVDEAGAPKIIEANCINGSGLYYADTLALVRAVSFWQEANWKE